jgi:hypothetical protein
LRFVEGLRAAEPNLPGDQDAKAERKERVAADFPDFD